LKRQRSYGLSERLAGLEVIEGGSSVLDANFGHDINPFQLNDLSLAFTGNTNGIDG
jgi:hypothetical protein